MRFTGLNRQIILSMSVLMVSSILIIWIGSWTFFAIAFKIDPGMLSEPDDWSPSTVEWLWIFAITIFGLGLAAFFALKLASRILKPINSVMDSVRRVAQGDLSARAFAGDRSLGETAGRVKGADGAGDGLLGEGLTFAQGDEAADELLGDRGAGGLDADGPDLGILRPEGVLGGSDERHHGEGEAGGAEPAAAEGGLIHYFGIL